MPRRHLEILGPCAVQCWPGLPLRVPPGPSATSQGFTMRRRCEVLWLSFTNPRALGVHVPYYFKGYKRGTPRRDPYSKLFCILCEEDAGQQVAKPDSATNLHCTSQQKRRLTLYSRAPHALARVSGMLVQSTAFARQTDASKADRSVNWLVAYDVVPT